MSYTFIISALVIFVMYIGFVLYLMRREPKHSNTDYDQRLRFERIREKYTSLQVYEEADLILDKDPTNQETRAEIITARFLDFNTYSLEKAQKHALWFLERAPIHLVMDFEGGALLTQPPDSEDEEKILNTKILSIWEKHLSNHPKNIFYLRAAANSLRFRHKDESKKIYRRILKEYPFCAESMVQISKLEEWDSANGVLYKHPTEEHRKAYNLQIKRLHWPWNEVKSSMLAQLKFRYGNVLLPNWLCFLTLYIDSALNWNDRPWNDYYFVSHLGMLAFQCGDYSLARKCKEQFLKLQPEAQKRHNYLPIYATGFNLAAILALKEENFQLLEFFLDKRAEDEANSEFAFHSDIELLVELVRNGHQKIAADFMKKRARNNLSDPNIIAEIEYVENGGRPYSEEYYNWVKDKSDKKV